MEAAMRKMAADFERQGYSVLENFLTEAEVGALKAECAKLVEEMDPAQHRAIFSTGDQDGKRPHISDDYFIDSGDKIRYFFEEGALDDEGNLKVDKSRSLNKIGHALHWLNPVFKRVSFSDGVKDVLRALGFVDPVLVQSMYIFKNPEIGGEVTPHQDGTFLHTTPPDKLVGLWFPLEDATLDNGCLWFVPGSHRREIARRFVRNPAHPRDPQPRLLFTGAEEKAPSPEEFVPVPAAKGSCVVIHGQVIHKSERNTSPKARPAYTFHVVDQHETRYSAENWLQPSPALPFPSVYRVQLLA